MRCLLFLQLIFLLQSQAWAAGLPSTLPPPALILQSLSADLCARSLGLNSTEDKTLPFKVLQKNPVKIEDHVFGLKALGQVLARYPIEDVDISLPTLNDRNEVGYFTDPLGRTFQNYIQDTQVSEEEKRAMLRLIISRRDHLRSAIRNFFPRVVSSPFTTVDLQQYGQIVIYRDQIFENQQEIGSFYLGLHSFSLSSKTKKFTMNFPAFFRRGFNPKAKNLEPLIFANTNDESSKQILSRQETRSRQVTVAKSARHEQRQIQEARDLARRTQKVADFVGTARPLVPLSETQTPLDRASDILEWAQAPASLFAQGVCDRGLLEQLYQKWNEKKPGRQRQQINRLVRHLSSIEKMIPTELKERFLKLRQALLLMIFREVDDEKEIEALAFQMELLQWEDGQDPEKWLSYFETAAVQSIRDIHDTSTKIANFSDVPPPKVSGPNTDLQGYINMTELQRDFDVLARKSAIDQRYLSEVDVAMAEFSHGIPSFRVQRRGDHIRFSIDRTQKVFAVGSEGALSFQGKLSRGLSRRHLGVRHYALAFTKGFIRKYGQRIGNMVLSNGEFIATRQPGKVFQIVYEKATIEDGQVHINLSQDEIQMGNRKLTQLEFFRENAIAVFEFDSTGKIISRIDFRSRSL